ncbi:MULTISPECIES: acyl-CoA dehydratase activase [unclassified Sphingomonas]|uniref:acyl-CoA dehydratase activase n=1 Tax=unclassified Sphingomonas TaxID=196159 RepID=UPI00082BDECE|nr:MULTISPECIES: acyl-CoA dehydratase activase [unclassified Sphingomonas]
MSEAFFMGVDLGSTTAKTVIVDAQSNVVAASVVQMGAVSRAGMQRSIDHALGLAGIEQAQIGYAVGTGYGRRLVPGIGRTFTEITCHARGAAMLVPGARLVVDIGGQDSKAILIDRDGLVENFAMNDRCASGTGRFYEVLARALECEVSEVGDLALQGHEDLEVSSLCATFAETEIIALLAGGAERADVAMSVHRAITHRLLGLIGGIGKHAPVVMTGGVARNPAAVQFLSEALELPVSLPPDPQIIGAFGAALLALEAGGHVAMRGDLAQLEMIERRVEDSFLPANRPLPSCFTGDCGKAN